MKIIGFVFLALLGLSNALPSPLQNDDKLHIPDKCSDVLAVKVCDNLVEIAKRLQLKAEDVTKAVVDAVKKGKTSSTEIYNAAKDFLMNEVLTKKCEDFTSADNCKKLREVAKFLKLNAAKVEEFVIKAVAEGAVQAKDIYAKAMEYYKNEIATKKCEDFLSVSQCSALRTIASKLKVKFDDLEDAIKEKYLETLGDATALYKKVVAVLKDYALNTKCEDLLNPDLCAALRKFAQTTKVQFPVLMEKAVDLLIKGYDVSKSLLNSVYKLVDHFYDCTDIFDQSSCDKLYKVASYLGVAHQKVEEFIKKYVPIAIEKGKDIINDFPALLKEATKYIKNLWCDKTPFCFNSDDVNVDAIAFANDNGFFDFDLIKQKIKEYIEIKYPGLQDKVKQRILEIINKAKSLSQLLKDAAFEIFSVGGESASTIRSILKDLIQNIKNIIYPPKTSFDIESKRSIDLQVLKQKLKDYIEEKYPGLQAEIKKQLTVAIDKAQNQLDIAVQFVKAMWNTGKDKVAEYIKIAKELIAKAKDLALTN